MDIEDTPQETKLVERNGGNMTGTILCCHLVQWEMREAVTRELDKWFEKYDIQNRVVIHPWQLAQ